MFTLIWFIIKLGIIYGVMVVLNMAIMSFLWQLTDSDTPFEPSQMAIWGYPKVFAILFYIKFMT